MSKSITTALVNALILIGILLLAEGTVRFLFPEITSVTEDRELFLFDSTGRIGLSPGVHGKSFGANAVIDERGFRIDPQAKHDQNELTKPVVLVLGDSVTFPVGVEAAQGYPYLLAQQFPQVEIINTAVTSFKLTQYVDMLIKQLPKLRPTGIIIGVCLNDAFGSTADKKEFPDENRFSNPLVRWLRYFNYKVFNFNDFLNRYSRAYLLVKSVARDSSSDYLNYTIAAYESGPAMAIAERDFSRLAGAVEGQDIWLEIFLLPYEYQLRQRDPEMLLPQQALALAASRAGLSVRDLYAPMASKLDSEEINSLDAYLFNDGMHYSAEGHRLIAELVAKHIEPHMP